TFHTSACSSLEDRWRARCTTFWVTPVPLLGGLLSSSGACWPTKGSRFMNRSIRSIAASLAAAVCLWPVAAGAQEAQPLPATGMTVEQARNAFAGAGFQVGDAVNWSWTSPPVTSFQVHDPY